MIPEDLKRRMRFSHPDNGVSVRNRQYRWKNPSYEIKNIRRDAEDPNNSTVYYEDVGGNKYKTNAQMFVERFGDFYIESNLKYSITLLAQQDLSGLAAEAEKAGSFEEFKKDYTRQIKHGLYWHITDNPNFEIDPTTGPRDMSSMADPTRPGTPGTLMITSDIDYWNAGYNPREEAREGREEVTRPYAALIDMSEVPRNVYSQVNRGFGNEFFVSDISNVKVTDVMPIEEALSYDAEYDSKIPQSEEELRAFYDSVVGEKKEYQKPIISLKRAIKLLSQVPGYDSPTPAVENENPAAVDRSCPNCGYAAMGSAIGAALENGETELKCPRCGFSINIAPNEKFLMAREKMSKLNSAVKKFGQWKEHVMDLSDELYFPSDPEGENPTMHRIRELEEELGLPPLDLAEMPGMEEDYLAFLEDEAVTWKGEAKKAQLRERYPEEYDITLPEYSNDSHLAELIHMLSQYYSGQGDPIYAFQSRGEENISLGELQAIESELESIASGTYIDYSIEEIDDQLFEDQQTAEAWLPTIKKLLEELPEERWEKFYVGKKEAQFPGATQTFPDLTEEEWLELEKADKRRSERWEKEKEKTRKELLESGDYPLPMRGQKGTKKEAAYGHSFSPEFYGNTDSPKATERPTNVTDALASMTDEEWNEMAKEVFGADGNYLDLDTVMGKIMETDTIGTFTSPVDVWIDEEGYYTVDVYDEGAEETDDEFYTEEELNQAEEFDTVKNAQIYTKDYPPSASQEDAAYKVKAILSKMKPGEEIDAWGMSQEIEGVQPIRAEQILNKLFEEGLVTKDGNWFAPVEDVDWYAVSKFGRCPEKEEVERDGTWYSLVNEGR